MSHYKSYPAYKDSGVEWIGSVPEHWAVLPFKRFLLRNDGGAWGSDASDESIAVPVLRSTDQTVNGHWRISAPALRKLSKKELEATLLVQGDILITKSSGSADHIGKATLVDAEVADLKAGFSNFMQRLRLNASLLPRFSWYLLNSAVVREHYSLAATTTTGLANLSGGIIGEAVVALPPLPEQKQILADLDRETTRIDNLIEKKTRFIELLKEKRQALITQAVTKGLDPNVKIKDSGMPSVGQVPNNWEVAALRRSLRLKKRVVGQAWAGYQLLSLTKRGVIFRDTSENHGKFPESFASYQVVEVGDMVCCLFDIDETPRTVGHSTIRGMITGAYSVFGCEDQATAKYLYYLLLHVDEVKGLRPYYSGLRKTVRPPEFLSIRMPLPPREEMVRITSFIESEMAKIDALRSLTERSIQLLKERRSALITAAVTGQIDLREAA